MLLRMVGIVRAKVWGLLTFKVQGEMNFHKWKSIEGEKKKKEKEMQY